MDYLLLDMTRFILQKKVGVIRFFCSVLVGSLLSLLVFITPTSQIMLWMIQLIAAASMVCIAYYPLRIKEIILAVALLYLLSIALDGMLRFVFRLLSPAFKQGYFTFMMLLGIAIFATLFCKKMLQLVKQMNAYNHNICNVCVAIGEREAWGKGFLDSGNLLKEPITQRPVVVVEEAFLMKNQITSYEEHYFVIPYHAIGCNNGMLKGFLADEMIIEKDKQKQVMKHVMLGVYPGKLSGNDSFQMLLNEAL